MAEPAKLEPELHRLLQAEVWEARARGEPFTTLHLLRAILLSPLVRAALGGAAKPVEQAAVRALDAGVANADADAEVVETVLVHAVQHVTRSGGRWVAGTDVVIELAEMSGCAAGVLLAAHRVTPLTLKLQVSHPPRRRSLAQRLFSRRRPEPPPLGADDPVRVLIHNDAFTAKAFVVHVLERHFGATPAQADALTEAIHTTGRAVVGELPHADAIRRIDDVTREAREQGFPLRLSIDIPRADLPRAELRRR